MNHIISVVESYMSSLSWSWPWNMNHTTLATFSIQWISWYPEDTPIIAPSSLTCLETLEEWNSYYTLPSLEKKNSPFLARSQNCERRLSSCLSVRRSVRLSAWKNSAHTGRNFMKFYIWVFFEKQLRKSKFNQNLARITGTLLEDHRTFLIISRSFLLSRMRNV